MERSSRKISISRLTQPCRTKPSHGSWRQGCRPGKKGKEEEEEDDEEEEKRRKKEKEKRKIMWPLYYFQIFLSFFVIKNLGGLDVGHNLDEAARVCQVTVVQLHGLLRVRLG